MSNEKRLIDAIALCESFEKTAYKCEHIDDMVFHLDYILDEITGADEVDAVEVVHAVWVNVQNGKGCCSNCHRLDSIDNLATHCRYCGAKIDICEIAENIESCEDCGFCSYGERREGE